jgi:hypothetical protein
MGRERPILAAESLVIGVIVTWCLVEIFIQRRPMRECFELVAISTTHPE